MVLAVWQNRERFRDIKYLAFKTDSDLYTALNNNDNRDCNNKDGCHGKLIWQQEENGLEEYFRTKSFFKSMTASSHHNNAYRAQIFKKNGDVEGIEYWQRRKVVCGGKWDYFISCWQL